MTESKVSADFLPFQSRANRLANDAYHVVDDDDDDDPWQGKMPIPEHSKRQKPRCHNRIQEGHDANCISWPGPGVHSATVPP